MCCPADDDVGILAVSRTRLCLADRMLTILLFLLFLVVLLSSVRSSYRPIVVTAYIVRVFLCLIHAYVITLPDSQFDAVWFEHTSWIWAKDGTCFDDFATGSRLYAWIGSCIYIAFGRSLLILQLMNAFFGSLIVLVAMKTIRLLVPDGTSYRRAGWVLSFYPSLLLYSAITMREVPIVLALMVSLYWLVRWRTSGQYDLSLLWCILWMAVSQMFHTGMVTGTAMLTTVVMFFTVKEQWSGMLKPSVSVGQARAMIFSLVLSGVIFAGASIMLSGGHGLDKIQVLRTERLFDALTGWQDRAARGRASYLDQGPAAHSRDLLLQIPARLAYFLGAPFPWQISRVRDLFGFVDGVFLVMLFLSIARKTWKGAWCWSTYRSLIVVVFPMILGFAVVTSNYGTAFRHRAKFVPALIVLYAYGASAVKRQSGAREFGADRRWSERAR